MTSFREKLGYYKTSVSSADDWRISLEVWVVNNYAHVPSELEVKMDAELERLDGAWRRGNDAAFAAMCEQANRILDGKPIAGITREPWQSLRVRLAALKAENCKLRSEIADMVEEKLQHRGG